MNTNEETKRNRLWVALVSHVEVPGRRLAAFFQSDEPTAATVKSRFSTLAEAKELKIVGGSAFDVSQEAAADLQTAEALRAFAQDMVATEVGRSHGLPDWPFEGKGSVGKHDWAVGPETSEGYMVFVDDRPVSYRETPPLAVALALDLIARIMADGDYRLNDKPAGFAPPRLK